MASKTILHYPSAIESVRFSVLNDDKVPDLAAVRVSTTDQFKGSLPVPHGLYDAHMGTTNMNYPCATCTRYVNKCPGHYGYHPLNYPLVHAIYDKYIKKNMDIICCHCCKYIMNPDLKFANGNLVYPDHPRNNPKATYEDILFYIVDQKTGKQSKAAYCDYCNRVDTYVTDESELKKFNPFKTQPHYKFARGKAGDDLDRFFVLEEMSEFNPATKNYISNIKLKSINEYSVLYFPHDCKKRFEMLPVSELTKHGIHPDTHPKNFIFNNLVIPPSNLRHVNKKKNEVYNNFMTSAIENIIKTDQTIDKTITYHDAAQFAKQIKIAATVAFRYREFIVASSTEEADVSSINSKIKGKKGLLRGACLGKLVSKVSRCVITCNVNNDIDEVNIPHNFSTTICIKEVVTPYNRARLQQYVNNGSMYPGCSKIKFASEGGKKKRNNGEYKIKPGDVVFRDVVNGDTLPITRFPSLFVTSTINARVIVSESKDNNSTGMNVIGAVALNGDFDGDTVSCFQNADEDRRAQFDILGNIERNFTSGIDGSAIYGLAQDTIAGCGYLTMESTKLDIMQVKFILNGVPINTKLENRIYEGRELFSMVMPRIDLEVPSPFFKNKFIEVFGDFSEKDKKVVIKDGKLLSGIVCDALIKVGKKNTIYHIIYNYYGAKKALEVIRNHQIIVQNFLKIYGMSLDYDSFILSDETREMVRNIQSSLLYKINEINRKLMNGEITPPSGVSIYNHVENIIIKTIRSMSGKYVCPVLAGVDINKNWLVQMWLLGSKGSFDNIEKMLVTIGQVYLDSKRAPYLLDYLRTNIWSQQFSLAPESRGYVTKSYFDGYDLRDMAPLSREARNNIITKGLVTSDGGTEGRNMIKNSESLVVDNRLFVSRSKGAHILQITANDDLIDHKNLFPSKYVLFNQTDEYIKTNYPAELHKQLIAERNEYAEMCVAKEKGNLSYTSNNSVLSPLNMPQIINIILGNTDTKTINKSNIASILNNYCDNLHLKRFNEGFVKFASDNKIEIPNTFKHAFTTMRILIRSSFNNSVFDRISATPDPDLTMQTILAKVTNQILTNMVEPGLAYGINVSLTLTSPFTQYLIDAHHSSASGGTSRDNIKQFKTTVYLKPIESMHFRKTYVFLKPEFEENKENAIKLANFIETQRMSDYTKEIRMLCEDPGEFVTFPDDSTDVKRSITLLDIKLTGMRNFVFRIVMDKNRMISKGVGIINTITRLEDVFKNLRCAYREDSKNYIIYMFFDDQFTFDLPTKKSKGKGKQVEFMTKMETFANYIKDKFVINSIKDLTNVEVKSLKRNYINNGIMTSKDIFYVEADGINLADMYLINVVDKTRTFCNNVQEMFKYCGFMEARCRIIDILNSLFMNELGLLITNYTMIADIMMELGEPAGLTQSSLAKREDEDPLVVAAYKNPLDPLCDAATNAINNKLTSPTAGLISGQVINFGTSYNKVIRNPEFVSVSKNDEDLL